MTAKEVIEMAHNNYLQTLSLRKFSESIRKKSEQMVKRVSAVVSCKKKKNRK